MAKPNRFARRDLSASPAMPPVRFVNTNGIRMAVYESGSGFPIVLLHGWPELAYSWRYQIAPLVDAGYRVIVPDQRGYGLTDRPAAVEHYDMFQLTRDLTGLLDALEIDRAVFCGHDWGGIVGWQMPLMHRDRVAGVVGVNTPFFPRLPIDPVSLLRFVFGDDMYVVQLQEYGVVDDMLSRDVERVFRTQMRRNLSASGDKGVPIPRHRLEFLKKFERPESATLPGESFLSAEELAFFVSTYQITGFTGGINWYRNLTRNWIASAGVEQKVHMPALMIGAEDDVLLPPALTNGMESYVPDLEKHVLPACGHWAQQERPAEVNRILIDWLQRRKPFRNERETNHAMES